MPLFGDFGRFRVQGRSKSSMVTLSSDGDASSSCEILLGVGCCSSLDVMVEWNVWWAGALF